jgi:exoribonuclease-2
MQTEPGPHEGLGVENYSWCTSPLRRYVDLVNQWQLIAMAQHGVTAKLVAPFKPKDADLMAITADFDGTYAAYGEYQNQMERYWCLMYLKQLGLTWKGVVRHLKEGQARVEEIPLRLNVPELSEQARGARAEVEVLDIDFLSLEASVRYLGMIDSANDAETLFQSDLEADTEPEPESITEINKEALSPDAHPGSSQ